MTKKEAAVILAILKAAYPNSYKNMTQDDAMGTITVWAVQFSDIPADIVLMAVHKAISTSTFPPSISEVKAKLSKLYWEAESLLYDRLLNEGERMNEKKREAAKRICEITKKYGYSNNLEPSLGSLLTDSGKMLLDCGTND